MSQIAALGTVFLISSRFFVGSGITLGYLATLLTAPLWFGAFRRYTGGRWLIVVGAVATVSSVWLTVAASADHETTSANLIANTLLITGSVAAIGVLVWARNVLPAWLVGAVYGVGMLASVFSRSSSLGYNQGSGGETNIWKFSLAVPIAVLTLALANKAGKRWLQIVVLVALGLTSAKLDSRSYFGEFAIAALLIVWQMLPKSKRRGAAARVLVLFGIVVVAGYNIGVQLLVDGVLGAATQARSIAQIDQAGSILAGGRPEMGATAALFLYRPIGFGGGTIATFADVNVAKAGMQQLNYDPDNGYVENFLFGTKFELHSVTGDLWAYAGFAGIALAALSAVLLMTILGRGIAARKIDGLVLFLLVQSCWNLFFNPLYSSAPVLVLALGLGLMARGGIRPSAKAGPVDAGQHPLCQP